MTVERRNQIVKYLPIGLSTTTLIFVATLAYNTGQLKAEMQKDIRSNSDTIEKHIDDKVSHIELEKQITLFMPRVELEKQMEQFSKQLDRIEEKLDEKKY